MLLYFIVLINYSNSYTVYFDENSTKNTMNVANR